VALSRPGAGPDLRRLGASLLATGTGLCLSIAHAHGGTVTATARTSGGLRVTGEWA
jgi:hypothetical protein